MSLAPPPFADVAAPITRSYPDPQILWPTCPGYGDSSGSDSSTFPCLQAIKARRAAPLPAPLSAFVDTVRAAQDRIYVIDDYLFKPLRDQSLQNRYDQILCWLPVGLVAKDIRFLTNALENREEQDAIVKLFDDRLATINQCAARRTDAAKIEIRFSLGTKFPYLHDRFAIIDSELWHFGATVGGLHNLVTAATRGWDAETHDAVRFFNDAWNGDGDVQRGVRHG